MAPATCISMSAAVIHIHILHHVDDVSIQGLCSAICYQLKSLKCIQERGNYKVYK